MHALHVTTPKHCHIVAMGMTLLQLPNSLSSAYPTLEVLSIKHWRQSAFAKTPLTVCHSREAHQRRASMLVMYALVLTNVYVCTYSCPQQKQAVPNYTQCCLTWVQSLFITYVHVYKILTVFLYYGSGNWMNIINTITPWRFCKSSIITVAIHKRAGSTNYTQCCLMCIYIHPLSACMDQTMD